MTHFLLFCFCGFFGFLLRKLNVNLCPTKINRHVCLTAAEPGSFVRGVIFPLSLYLHCHLWCTASHIQLYNSFVVSQCPFVLQSLRCEQPSLLNKACAWLTLHPLIQHTLFDSRLIFESNTLMNTIWVRRKQPAWHCKCDSYNTVFFQVW